MATKKITDTEYNANQKELAALAKAMAHPARVAILQHLLAKNACVCGELVAGLPLSQATVSQHLKALKSAGLIQGNIAGPSVCYCIDPKTWAKARALLGVFFGPEAACSAC